MHENGHRTNDIRLTKVLVFGKKPLRSTRISVLVRPLGLLSEITIQTTIQTEFLLLLHLSILSSRRSFDVGVPFVGRSAESLFFFLSSFSLS